MRNERPDPIDALIDEAARRLVAGEPSSALRSGVLSRIGRRRSAWWPFVPALAGAAMVAIAIVGRALMGTVDAPDGKPAVAGIRIEHPAPVVASRPADVTPIQPAQTEARQLTRRLATAIPLLPPAEEESPIPPITIEPLATPQIALETSSGAMPIDIEPLQIEPLLGQGQ